MHRTVVTLVTGFALGFVGLEMARAADFIVTSENVAALVRQGNLELAAARLDIEDARARAAAAGRWSNPTVEIAFDAQRETGERATELGLFQRFPVTGRLGVERDLSQLQARSTEAAAAELERRLVVEARLELIELLAVQRHRALLERQLELAERLAAFVAESAARGELSPLDAAQAKLDTAWRENDLHHLHESEIESTGRLRELLGMSTIDRLRVEGELPEAALREWSVNPENVPSYRRAVLDVEAAEVGSALERARRVGDFEVGVVTSFGRSEDVPVGLEDDVAFGVRLRAPVPLWNRNQDHVRAAEAREERHRRVAVALAQRIRVESETARQSMEHAYEVLEEIREVLLPAAEGYAESVERTYREGLGDLQSTLRARKQLLEIRIAEIDALREFHRSRVRYQVAADPNDGGSR